MVDPGVLEINNQQQHAKSKLGRGSRAFKLSYQQSSSVSDTSALFAERRQMNKTSGFVFYGAY